MRHLYVQIYIALVAILVLFGVLVFATWLLLPPSEERQRLMTGSAAVLGDLLPPLLQQLLAGPEPRATRLGLFDLAFFDRIDRLDVQHPDHRPQRPARLDGGSLPASKRQVDPPGDDLIEVFSTDKHPRATVSPAAA